MKPAWPATRQKYMASMEGAVLSGKLAAQAVCEAADAGALVPAPQLAER